MNLRRLPGPLLAALLVSSARASGPITPWTSVPVGERAAFATLVPSAAQPGRVFAAGQGGGMWRSDDHGDTWIPAREGLPRDVTFEVLAASPVDANVAFASSRTAGLFRTTNGGTVWAATSGRPGGDRVEALAFHPSNSLILWAGTSGGAQCGVWRSTDGGQSWTPAGTGLPASSVFAIAVHPTDAAQLLAGTSTGIIRSTDGGTSWSAAFAGPRVYAIDWNVAQPNVVWAVPLQGGLLRSTDLGQSWATASTAAGDLLAVDPTDPSRLFLGLSLQGCGARGYGYYGSIRRSTDAGASWQVAKDSPVCETHASALDVDPRAPSRVYAAFSEGLFRSEAGGAAGSWVEQVDGIHMFPTSHVRVGAGDKWYVRSDANRGTFISSNGGDDWLLRPPLAGSHEEMTLDSFDVNAVVPDLFHESGVAYDAADWCVSIIPFLMRSTALGWQDVAATLVASGPNGQTVYSWRGADLWRSDDGLQSLTYVGPTFPAIDAVAFGPQHLFATVAGRDPVRLSTDNGVTWVSRSTGLPSRATPVRILCDLSAASHLLVAFARHGVYESTDLGGSWHALPFALTRTERPPFATAPGRTEAALTEIVDAAWDVSGNERRVFLATTAGVFVEGYGFVDDELGSFRTTSIAYSRARETLLVGTAAHGVFALDMPAVGAAHADRATDVAVLPTAPALVLAPNPFVGAATIRFSVPAPGGLVHLDVMDAAGRRVRRVFENELPPGTQAVTWDGRDAAGRQAAAGVYFFRLDVDGKVVTKQGVHLVTR